MEQRTSQTDHTYLGVSMKTTSKRCFYQADALSVEIKGSSNRVVFYSGNMPLAELASQQDGEESKLLSVDGQGSIMQVKRNEAIRLRSYTAHGHASSETRLDSILAFNSQPVDEHTGYYLLGHGYRAYNTRLMCFTSPDSLSPFEGGGLNAYGYCAGDPVNRSDPTGHMFNVNTGRIYPGPRAVAPHVTTSTIGPAALIQNSTAPTSSPSRFSFTPSSSPANATTSSNTPRERKPVAVQQSSKTASKAVTETRSSPLAPSAKKKSPNFDVWADIGKKEQWKIPEHVINTFRPLHKRELTHEQASYILEKYLDHRKQIPARSNTDIKFFSRLRKRFHAQKNIASDAAGIRK